jgi:4-amino-4-deoxy-L-arabinose transferase-like glycosyltransferase
MQQNRWVTGGLCALFMLCIGYALMASLTYYVGELSRPHWYLALFLLGMAAIIFMGTRIARHMPEHRLAIAHAFFVAGLLGVAYALRMAVIQNIAVMPASDFKTYYSLGALLAEDRLLTAEGLELRQYVAKYPHTIGFPSLVLAPIFRVFGASVRTALYANLALSLGAVWLVYAIARRLYGRPMGLMAMAAAAVWPSHVLYANMVASEPAFMFLLLLSLYLLSPVLLRSAVHPHPLRMVAAAAGAGLLLGLANAVRPVALVLLIAISITCLLRREKPLLARGWLLAAVVMLGFFISWGMAARHARSLIRMEPVGGLIASGYNMMVGTNAEHGGFWNAEDAAFFDGIYAETDSAEAAHRAGMEVAIARIVQSPLDTLGLFLRKYSALWQADDFAIEWNLMLAEEQSMLTPGLNGWLQALRPPSAALYSLLLSMALLGAAWQWRRKGLHPIAMISMLFFIGTALLHMVLETQPRYHYHMIPFFLFIQRKGGIV